MNRKLEELLVRQREPWPQWQRGFIERAGKGPDGQEFGRAPSTTLHMFLAEPILEPIGGRALYRVVPACHFIDGAEFVAFDHSQELDHSDWRYLCFECWSASLTSAD